MLRCCGVERGVAQIFSGATQMPWDFWVSLKARSQKLVVMFRRCFGVFCEILNRVPRTRAGFAHVGVGVFMRVVSAFRRLTPFFDLDQTIDLGTDLGDSVLLSFRNESRWTDSEMAAVY